MSFLGSLGFKAAVLLGIALISFGGGMGLEYKISLSSYLGLEARYTQAEVDAYKQQAAETARQAQIAADAARADAAHQQSVASDTARRLAEYQANAKAHLRCAVPADFARLFNDAVSGAPPTPGKRP